MYEIRSTTLIALGSNLPSGAGGPDRTLVAAIAAMARAGLEIRAVSRFFATPCFPVGAGPDFVNAAVALATGLAPRDVLAILHRIEAGFGRERLKRWGQRTLDLDLLASGDTVLPDPRTQRAWIDLAPDRQAEQAPDQLILPHPRLQERAFVLVPLAEIAPVWRHPVLGLTVSEMLHRLPAGDLAGVRAL